jgi:CelD/BcsL family acetyltransferase involved in cellulose biosynthesis
MVIDLAPYGELIDGLKSKFRNNLRRSDRRLRELGSVAFRWIHGPGELAVALDTFVSLERSGWKGSESSTKAGYPRPAAIGLEDWKYAFYSALLQCFARLGAVNMLLVEVDDRAVGGQISLEIGPTNYLLKTTMDESIEGIAIGHLMINELLRKLDSDRRVDQVNLLTDYAWHEPWKPRRLDYVDTWIYNRTAVGLLAALRRRHFAF